MARPSAPPDLASRTSWVSAALMVLTASFILVKTGRDALYFQEGGLFDLPYAYFGIMLASAPTALGTLELMRRLGSRTARLVLPMIVAAALLVYVPFASAGGGIVNTLFFVLVPTVWGVMFSLSWLLAADLFEGEKKEDLSRAYARIGAASLIGGVLGAVIAKLFSGLVAPEDFVFFGSAGLVLSTAIMAAAQGQFLAPVVSRKASNAEAAVEPSIGMAEYREVFSSPYSSMLFFIASAAALTGVLVEFQFYLAAATSSGPVENNTDFFANFYLALNGGALLVQLILMPRLQKWVGVHGSLLTLPLALLGGAAALVFAGGSAGLRSAIRVTEGGIKSSIHRANWEQAYLPLGRARRAVAKIIIDGMGARSGETIAALALLVWLRSGSASESVVGLDIRWVSWALGAAALTWVLLTRRLGQRLNEHCSSTGVNAADYSSAAPMPDT